MFKESDQIEKFEPKVWLSSPTMHGEEFEFLKEYAKTMGDHNADWVEQSLEWAQRISNGESWKKLCNKRDTTKWYRLVEGPNGELWQVGGSAEKDIKEVSYSCTCLLYTSDAADE